MATKDFDQLEFLKIFGGYNHENNSILIEAQKYLELNPINTHISNNLMDTSTRAFIIWFLKTQNNISRILELGTYCGITTLALSQILNSIENDSNIINCNYTQTKSLIDLKELLIKYNINNIPYTLSIDINSDYINYTKNIFKLFHKKNIPIIIHQGDALECLEYLLKFPEFLNTFDVILVDADKLRYLQYLMVSQKLLKYNGIIFFDNVLWRNSIYKNFYKRISRTTSPHIPYKFTLKEIYDIFPNDPALYYAVHNKFLNLPPSNISINKYLRRLRREANWLQNVFQSMYDFNIYVSSSSIFDHFLFSIGDGLLCVRLNCGTKPAVVFGP